MKKNYIIIQFIAFLMIFLIGASLLIFPSLGFENENYLFFMLMVSYSLISYVLYMSIRREKDYEYLLISLVSLIAGISGVVFNNQSTKLVLSLSLIGWISMVAIIKLIKIDYYHDNDNRLWIVRTITFVLFIIIGTLTSVNLYYNIKIQSLMLGFLFIVISILESFDPIFDLIISPKKIKRK